MNLKRYATLYTLAMLAVMAALWVLNWFGVSVRGSSLSFVPAIVAAMGEGQAFARDFNAKPESAAAWRFSLQASLFSLIPQGLVAGVVLWLDPETFAMITGLGAGLLVVVITVLLLIGLGLNRAMLMFGAKQALKAKGAS